MKFVIFDTDSRRVRTDTAAPIGSIVYPVTDDKFFFENPEAAIELIQPRLFGWLPKIFKDKRSWVLGLTSDDAYPKDFSVPGYRAQRTDEQVGQDEAKAHEVTYDVAMTTIQQRAANNFFTKPLAFMMVTSAVGFFLMLLVWVVTGVT